jgi:hypothetical protein
MSDINIAAPILTKFGVLIFSHSFGFNELVYIKSMFLIGSMLLGLNIFFFLCSKLRLIALERKTTDGEEAKGGLVCYCSEKVLQVTMKL